MGASSLGNIGVNLDYLDNTITDASQLRNVISGYVENVPGDDEPLFYDFDYDMYTNVKIYDLCETGDPEDDSCEESLSGYSIVNVVNNYIGNIIAYNGEIMPAYEGDPDDEDDDITQEELITHIISSVGLNILGMEILLM